MLAQNEIERSKGPLPITSRRVLDFTGEGISDVLALGRYEYHAVQPGLSAHCHPGAVEICYLERGCQTYRLANRIFRLRGGDVLIVPPGLMHDTGERPEDCGVLYWLILRLPEAPATLLDLTVDDSAALAAKLVELPRKFTGRPTLRKIFRTLFELHDAEQTPLKALSIRHQLLCCLLEVMRCAESRKQRVLSGDIQRTAEMIRSQPQEEFALSKLAALAGLSLSRFKVKFKEEMGVAPREFILRVKMQCARRALAQSNDPVTEIAVSLGFSSSQYFATVFKRFSQMTPLAYRERHAILTGVAKPPRRTARRSRSFRGAGLHATRRARMEE